MSRLIAETLAEIQKLLDDHPRAEQAQARAFIDARYPDLISIAPKGKNPVQKPPDEPSSKGADLNQLNRCNGADLHKVVGSFLQFWSEYPKRTGKQEALRIWKKLNPDEALVSRILQSVREQKTCEQWTKDSGQFIPHPKTWLNQARWEDEPSVQIGSNGGAIGSLAGRLWRRGSQA